MAIAIDAQILIWGIKKQSTPNRADMIPRAEAFFQACSEDRIPIILPAQALAEFLVGYTEDQQRQSLAQIPKGFIVSPFDAKAASIAAKLQTEWNTLKEIMVEYGLSRAQIKADINVIASAVAAGASHLFSEDRQMVSLAQGSIIVKQLPPVPPDSEKVQDRASKQQSLLPPDEP